MHQFLDRQDAGRQLARKLSTYENDPTVIVLALPRGGVPVAYEVALRLQAPLDVLVVRKLGLPGHEELAIGAIASGGIRILNLEILREAAVDPTIIEQVTRREAEELRRREEQYRGNRPALNVQGRTVILIDDGLATGATMLAAVHALRRLHPERIVVAVPVAASQAIRSLQEAADEIIHVGSPDFFEGVGKWYQDFSQTTDAEVQALLEAANKPT